MWLQMSMASNVWTFSENSYSLSGTNETKYICYGWKIVSTEFGNIYIGKVLRIMLCYLQFAFFQIISFAYKLYAVVANN